MIIRRAYRHGFTLIELLVVLAIVSLLAGLVLAAVQRARDAAARTSCASRVRQLALGVQMYAGTHRRLPAGCDYPVTPPGGKPTGVGVSWQTSVLPFVDQGALWDQATGAYGRDPTGTHDPGHAAVLASAVTVFLCPSEGRTHGTNGLKARWGVTSYIGVAGTDLFANDGIFHKQFTVRLTDITDGTANTIMIGERPPGPNGAWSSWYGNWGACTCPAAQIMPAGYSALVRSDAVGCPLSSPSFAPGRIDDACASGRFWSLHAGGATFAFADGSVRFLRYSASPILPALATRADGDSAGILD